MDRQELDMILNNLVSFLGRVDLKGSEVNAFNQVLNWVAHQKQFASTPNEEQESESS